MQEANEVQQRSTLFSRTSLTIFIAIFIYVILASIVIFVYLMQPMAKQSAGDLAALMVLSAQTWVELPADARPRFEEELVNYHDISISTPIPPIKKIESKHLFFVFLQQALEKRLNNSIKTYTDASNDNWVWIDIPMAEHNIHIHIPYSHVKPNPPIAIFILLAAAGILIFITSNILVKRLTRPLEQLSDAAVAMGKGKYIDVLPESGAKELALLTRSFNQMNQQVQQLLNNRTTLMAGISHDLRTPISRIQLALEFIDKKDRELVQGIQNDLDEMNQLISQTMELANSQNASNDTLQLININDFIKRLILKYPDNDITLNSSNQHCEMTISITSLQRILQNLIDNAIRYGNNQHIDIQLVCSESMIVVDISDAGSGIPEKLQSIIFQPFYRIDSSRNTSTGGNGLGLAIVKQLCEIYEWDIAILTSSDQGTTFRLSIPKT